MGTKRLFLALFITILLSQAAFTQEEPQQDESRPYHVVTDDSGEEYIVQHFEWAALDDIKGYEFNLEVRGDDGTFAPYEGSPFFTEDNFIEIPLPAGEYQYTVTVLNFFGKRAYTTNSISVNIIKAYKPELNSVSPASIYLDEAFGGSFTLSGAEFSDETVFTLVTSLGRTVTPYEVRVDENGRRAEVLFDEAQIDTGDYVMRVENPGGFSAHRDVRVRFRKPFDLDVSVGYSPLLLLNSVFSDYAGGMFRPLAANAKISFLPVKHRFGYLGGAVSALYTPIRHETPGWTLTSSALALSVLFVYQKPTLRRRLIFDFHGGVGLLWFPDMKFTYTNGITSAPLNSLNISVTAGAAADFYILRRLYVEVGVDIACSFGNVIPYAYPSVSIGWQF